jgi:hypothetical protein
MLARQEEITAKLASMENQAIEQAKAVIPPDPTVIMDEQYQRYFSGVMDKEEFKSFVQDSTEYFNENPMTLKDVYLLRNIDEIAEEIYNNGIQAGRAESANKFKTYGNHVQNYNDDIPEKEENFDPSFNLYNKLRT